MKLYCFPPSPNARKVIATAQHLHISLELQFLDLVRGDQNTPEYRQLNPAGRTPTLVDGDFVLWESNAIMQYLAGSAPENTLWPKAERARADISRWQCWQLDHWNRAWTVLVWENLVKKMFGGGDPDAAEVQRGMALFHGCVGLLDKHLAGRHYLTNNALTLADFAVAAPFAYAAAGKLPWDNYGHVRRWYANIDELDAWKNSRTEKTFPAF